jgi:LmbE family N-acetylglucosaminyl deacetylase
VPQTPRRALHRLAGVARRHVPNALAETAFALGARVVDGPARLPGPPPGPVLCVAAHPDDETIGCGGALARHAQRGDDVTVVVATSGEASAGGGHLAARREAEVAGACAALGLPRPPVLLRLPDGALSERVEALAGHVARHGARAATVYVPSLLDAHRDHLAANVAVARCGLPAQVLGCEVWSPGPVDALLDVTDVFARKEQALAGYATARRQVDYLRTARGLAAYRSASAGLGGAGYAEGFVTLSPARHATLVAKVAGRPHRRPGGS